MIFEAQSPKDLWQDFGCIKDSNIESKIYDIEREIEKLQNQITESTQPYTLPFRFSFQGQTYGIQYVPKEKILVDQNGRPILPFLLSRDISIYQNIHLLFGINEQFFLFFSDNIKSTDVNQSKAQNLSRFLPTLFLFQRFPLFVKLSTNKGFSAYVGNNQKSRFKYYFNSKIENRDESRLTRLSDAIHYIETMKISAKTTIDINFSIRTIYHFEIRPNLFFIICGEWPNENNKYMKPIFENAKQYIISIYQQDIDIKDQQLKSPIQNEFQVAFNFVEKHKPSFRKIRTKKESQFEDEFVFDGDLTDMDIKVQYVPSNTILFFLARHLTFEAEAEWDHLWFQFKDYIKRCIKNRKEILHVGLDSINQSDCLLYQKLVLINIAIQKSKLDNNTLNYILTSDMIKEIDRNIREKCLEIDSSITDQQVIKLRKEIAPKKSTNQSLKDYLKNKSGKQKQIAEAAWSVISPSLFDPQFLCEYGLDYIDGLNPDEVFRCLLFILLLERYNEYYDPDIEISIQIENFLNQLKFEMDVLNIHEFVQRCQTIESMIEELVIFKEVKDFFNFSDNFLNCQSIVNSLFQNPMVLIDDQKEKKAIINYFNELNDNYVVMKEEIQFIVNSSMHDDNINLEQRTFVLNDITNSKVIVASAAKEEFLYH